ncbi:MAG: ABC transporter permease [Gammaproteobacteria bacterium]|nr:ABC transporter permease [Gammaproteobacteria bacterium]
MGKLKNFLRGLGLTLIVIAGLVGWTLLPWIAVLICAMALAAWLMLTRSGQRTLSVARVGVAGIPQRWGASLVIVVGIAGVVGVLVALLAMGEGFQAMLAQTGSEDTAIVLRGGSQTELNSTITRDQATLVAQAPGVARDDQGRPIASAELVLIANLPKKTSGTDANVEIRGVGAEAFDLRRNVQIVEGRAFEPGLRELIVGEGAQEQFAGLDPGQQIELNNQQWTIVGVFASGDAHQSELWGDTETLASAYRREAFQSVTVRVVDSGAFDTFKAALASDTRLKLDVSTTLDYYSEQSEGLTKLIRILSITVGSIMAVGAIFGALNTMYAAVAGRAREIATLRAIGFRGLSVVVSVMLETMLLAFAGGVIGGFIAWIIFNGYTVSTLGSNFSQVVFDFRVSPGLLWDGLKWALAIGFVGGLFPAVRAARLPVATALREL